MKLNREKSAALLAAGILVLGLWAIVSAMVVPGPDLTVDVSLPTHSRDLIPQEFRTFDEVDAVLRNPFSFAEGWQSMETVPLPPPPLPSPGRIVPLLGAGAAPEDVGFFFQSTTPSQVDEEEEEETP